MQNKIIEKQIISMQKNELIGSEIYRRLAKIDSKNSELFNRLSHEELQHFEFFKSYTAVDNMQLTLKDKIVISFYLVTARILGIIFTIKLLEKLEQKTQNDFVEIRQEIPEIDRYIIEEELHEQELINLVDEDRLKYMSSIVLGLNDALVELTGALAGFTISIQDSNTIALLGLITGISAAFSMASSEYLSQKADLDDQEDSIVDVSPLKASIYTGIAYLFTVIILILPFLIFSKYLLALGITIALAIVVIFLFNYYISVAKDLNFKKRFIQMAAISIGVATISFIIGILVKHFLGLSI